MKKSFFAMVSVAVALSGCGGPALIGSDQVRVMDASTLPPPDRSDIAAGVRQQVIGPFDTVGVEVFGISELSRDVVVDAAGTIALPVAGVVKAAGMTSVELAASIQERLRAGSVRDPQVIVNVKQMISQSVTVEGAVRKAGNYPVTGRMTMLRAIAQAEGTNDYADASKVVVLRTVNNQRMAALYDVRAIRAGAYADPEIFPADTIVVGESNARRVLPLILQGAAALVAPLIVTLGQSN